MRLKSLPFGRTPGKEALITLAFGRTPNKGKRTPNKEKLNI
jgi:hypothetical protein